MRTYERWEDARTLESVFRDRKMTRDEYRYWTAAYRAYRTGRASSCGVPHIYGASLDTATFAGHLIQVEAYLKNIEWWRKHCPECEYRAISQRYRDYLYEQEADAGASLYEMRLEAAVSQYHMGYGNPSIPI